MRGKSHGVLRDSPNKDYASQNTLLLGNSLKTGIQKQ